MNHKEALETLAKECNATVVDIERMLCGNEICMRDPCPRYRELTATRTSRAQPDIYATAASMLFAPYGRGALPDDDEARLEYPMADGLLYYFTAALAEVSRISKIGNDQHNPGQPLHWARSKSTDHENKILRHLAEAGTKDSKGVRHSARLAWRALALLQVELEREEGAPLPRNAKF